MKRWMLPAALAALFTLALAFVAARRTGHSPNGTPPEKSVKLLTLSAMIDGSGRFIFTTNSVRIDNRHFGPPTDILFDGEPWMDTKSPPAGWTTIAPQLDLKQARIVQRRGRDLLALEQTESGFDLFYSDSPGGSGPYVITIAIPRL